MSTSLALNPFGGNVIIGKQSQVNGSYLLDVNGKIRSNEIVVNTTGADFVFEHNYDLKTLEEVEAYITQHKHLSEIPSAKEMEKEGMAVAHIQTKLLQKLKS